MTPHVNGQAGKQGVIDLQRRIGKIRRHATALQKAVEDRNERIRQLKAENRRFRELAKELYELADRGLMELDDDDFRRIVDEAEKLGVTHG